MFFGSASPFALTVGWLELKRILPSGGTIPQQWPVDRAGNPKQVTDLTLEQREKILQAAGALPSDFEKLYSSVRVYRNYMHPDRELKEQKPIAQSVAQLALACLNALTEQYAPLRFAAEQEWRLEHGLAQVPAGNVIQMPQNAGDFVSLLVSEQPAECLREIKFRVIVPPNAIFNFVYSFFSKEKFKAIRIEGREGQPKRGLDNGRLVCTKWRVWGISGQYTPATEPDPTQHEHIVRIVLDPLGTFTPMVDGVPLALERGIAWEFDPQAKIGFLTEHGPITIADLEVELQ